MAQSGENMPTSSKVLGSAVDSNFRLMKIGLSRWRGIWFYIRNTIQDEEWAKLGFFRTAYNYWLIIQLLLDNKGSPDLLTNMEVGCDDALKQIKALLKDFRD